jgi:16S rRNA (adenine1518-N6/adenine1519-N6)-dimethyltransferase
LPNVEVRNEDALEAPLPDRPYRAVGNLPYTAGTPILRRVIADPNCRRAVFMLQKEVAQRLTAKPRDEQYGYLTLYAAMFASARVLMKLGPKSFHPAPKVDSAVVVLDPRPPQYASDRDALIHLISASFRMRRKKLLNNLTDWPRERALQAMHEAGIAETARAEELDLAAFDRIARLLTAES